MGIGRGAVERLTSMLLAEDVASINLYAEPTVIGLYERLGFQKARLLTAQPCQASIVQQSGISLAHCVLGPAAQAEGAHAGMLCAWRFAHGCSKPHAARTPVLLNSRAHGWQ